MPSHYVLNLSSVLMYRWEAGDRKYVEDLCRSVRDDDLREVATLCQYAGFTALADCILGLVATSSTPVR